jgi:hypothetical protein
MCNLCNMCNLSRLLIRARVIFSQEIQVSGSRPELRLHSLHRLHIALDERQRSTCHNRPRGSRPHCISVAKPLPLSASKHLRLISNEQGAGAD